MVPKAKGEILGVVIVESGWGSMLPTIVLANLLPTGPAARCGQLNIGDQVKKSFFFYLLIFCIIYCKNPSRMKNDNNNSNIFALSKSTIKTYLKDSKSNNLNVNEI